MPPKRLAYCLALVGLEENGLVAMSERHFTACEEYSVCTRESCQTREVPSPLGGEKLVETYLQNRGLLYEYERLIGTRSPDFSVDHPFGTFVMEVYDPYIEVDMTHNGPIARQDFPRAFTGRKQEQILAVARAGLPFVGVIGSGNAQQEVDAFALVQTMFGDAGVIFEVSSDGIPGDSQSSMQSALFASEGSHVSANLNNDVSAMAVIDSFNPTQHVLNDALDAGLLGAPATSATDEEFENFMAARMDHIGRIAQELILSGNYYPEARAPRLRVVHNPWATRPLPYDRLAGPYDFQIGPWTIDGHVVFALVSEGRFAGPFRW